MVRRVDIRGGVTQTAYSLDGNTVTTTFPNGGTQIRKTDAIGRLLELSGTAVRPQVFTYGPLWERIATGARWERTERNLLGQVVREARPGANGATLETLAAYDGYGRVAQIMASGQPTQTFAYATTGEQTALTQTVGEEWRKQESETDYLLRDGEIWQRQVATLSCSDADIAPLTQQTLMRLSGLSPECSFENESVCPRGNITRTYGTDAERITVYPSRTNPAIERYAFGQLVETVDTACVTNRFEYDALDRRIASIDGRNNRTVYAYDAKGNLVSTTDAVGAVTAYGYDVMGQTVAVTNALGNVTVYEYDLRGNRTYEGGATYPVRYVYDVFGNKTSMTTYRNEASGVGDTTTWTYDEASGVLLSKTYADGKGLTYTYTDDGKLATRTNARGVVTTYTYDDWGQLLSVDYADTTPDIAYAYDAMGRQTSATDVAGTTTFTYDAFGQLLSEQVSGLYSKTLSRHWDAFGRNVGYSVDNERKQSIVYAPATGRISESDGFKWERTSSLPSLIPTKMWSRGHTNPTAPSSPPSPTPPILLTSIPTISSAAAPPRMTSSMVTTSETSSFPQTMFPMPTTISEIARQPKARPTPPTISTNTPPSTTSSPNTTRTATKPSSRPRPACGQSSTTPKTAPFVGRRATP